MIEIAGAVLSLMVALLPVLLAHAAERKPVKARKEIDALLTKGKPVDVAAELSRLYDATYDPAGQPPTDVQR